MPRTCLGSIRLACLLCWVQRCLCWLPPAQAAIADPDLATLVSLPGSCACPRAAASSGTSLLSCALACTSGAPSGMTQRSVFCGKSPRSAPDNHDFFSVAGHCVVLLTPALGGGAGRAQCLLATLQLPARLRAAINLTAVLPAERSILRSCRAPQLPARPHAACNSELQCRLAGVPLPEGSVGQTDCTCAALPEVTACFPVMCKSCQPKIVSLLPCICKICSLNCQPASLSCAKTLPGDLAG